jgi:hypothetical protein
MLSSFVVDIIPFNFLNGLQSKRRHVYNKDCYHEDGGTRAVFVEVDAHCTTLVSHHIDMDDEQFLFVVDFSRMVCRRKRWSRFQEQRL